LRYYLFLLLIALITCYETYAQDADSITVALQPIVVTATRMPTNALYVSRSIDIIDERAIENSGASCVAELLQNGANVDVQPRGIFGVQTDVSIRGALFSQHLLLLDGVRMNDPQTSHHNYDLPISIEQIQRIEVLKGPGSALYGPDAFGGVINIITRIPHEQTLYLNLSGGENGLMNASGNYNFSSFGVHSSNVIEYRRSDGYHFDTDFQTSSISSNNTLELPFGTYSLFGGYTNKAFGAFNFYGSSPSKEWTETTFFNMTTIFSFPSLLLQPKLSYRRHYDKFMFDIRIPDKFVNIHTTHSYNGELQSIIQIYESCSLIAGIVGNIDNIVSTNLQNHNRSSLGILTALHSVVQKNILVDFGMREDYHSQYGRQFNPTMNGGYLFSQYAKVFVTVGRSFRAPSYTELYYSSPTRIGNADLKSETGWSYEIGGDYTFQQQMRLTASLFERDQENLIDYVKFTAADPASRATNFTTAITRGVEIAFRWNTGMNIDQSLTDNSALQSVLVSYTYLDSRIDIGNIYSSVYSFTHPRHQLSAECSGILPLFINWTASATHKIKLDGTNYTLVDAKLSRMISNTNVFLQGTNLLNQSYEEIAGVPLPGRWLWVGVEFKVI
jgi:iron complex outermembrane receptor protein